MGQLQKRLGAHTVIAIACLAAYLAITCTVDLFHTEDCPVTDCDTGSSSTPCPACKFLAGANTTQVLYDANPMAIEHQIAPTPAPDSCIVVSRQCTGSITQRAPPARPLS